MDAEQFARLKSETRHPYRGLRRFIYVACAGSGGVGAFIFFLKVLSGQDLEATLPNLGLQVGVVALMVWLLRKDNYRPKS